jgi:hypothetical protein
MGIRLGEALMDLADIQRIADGKVWCTCGNNDWEQFLYVGTSPEALMAGCKKCGSVVMRKGDQWGVLAQPAKAPPLPIGVIQGALGRCVIIHNNHPGLAWSGSRWVPHREGIPTGDTQVCNFATYTEALEYIDEHFNAFYPPPPE